MPRKTANSTISQASTTVQAHENPFILDEHLDLFAVPIAHEVIKARLPERVEFHVRRVMTANTEADRAELLQVLKACKVAIAIEVFHAVLSYTKEQAQLKAANEDDRPVAE